jgi:predicted nucleic acid-binding protein
MILVDTSVWIDHLRRGDPVLAELLNNGRVLGHVCVTGELALGRLRQREAVLSALRNLPQANIATHDEVLGYIDRQKLFGLGIGFIDAHLLAAVNLTQGASLWTLDKQLHKASAQLGLSWQHH